MSGDHVNIATSNGSLENDVVMSLQKMGITTNDGKSKN